MQHSNLKTLIEELGLSQAELARGIGRSEAFVSRLLSGETGASQGTIAGLLAFLSERTGRRVTYEQLFPTAAGVA
jgi:transcriptional regulator with XRE-family HTH domain